ncbi:lung seven transmembrane receptor-domain-containing protein [Fimicolochytrium jonesii]|uniref:lung seven transmembrane receptor-domain-containing protein n=1 Tax=Fimicolochytrium jonesii TaxID=1396493 RepID=UPI0022FE1952|nr:lung seven transmembrane receptor-domain-containing protein [Fimicolochytrium jonesii]KAI8819315.1 lung seven transmembrane receptor-domain-containing protein [Fimicolochytrium jonesii]
MHSSRRSSSTRFRIALLLLGLLYCIIPVFAYDDSLYTDDTPQCWGMWGAPGDNHNGTITVKFNDIPNGETFALLVYEYQSDAIQLDETGRGLWCGKNAIDQGLCVEADREKWLVKNDAKNYVNELYVVNATEPAKTSEPFVYQVPRTGFYCVMAQSTEDRDHVFVLGITLQSAVGALPGVEYPKLPFYGVLSIVYLFIGVAWMLLSFWNWRDLLPVQHYISGVTIFLTLEMAFNYGFFEDYNRLGRSSAGLLVASVILNAGRNSISFFMLLIVALGYGVVRPTLGSTMKKCIYFTIVHFVCGVIYATSSLVVRDVTIWVLLFCVMPLSTTMTVFYFWTLNAITRTMEHLETRRQNVKLQMYRTLWRILACSIGVILIMFIVDTIFFLNSDSLSWMAKHWQVRWFMLDGWTNLLYLSVFLGLCILWRPTENNQRYGLDELAQDDYESDFRIAGDGPVAGQNLNLRKVPPVARDEEEGGFGGGAFDDEDEDDILAGEILEDGDDEDIMNWVEENVPDSPKRSSPEHNRQTPRRGDDKMQ